MSKILLPERLRSGLTDCRLEQTGTKCPFAQDSRFFQMNI